MATHLECLSVPPQVLSPVQQALCDLLAYPGSLDLITVLNLLSG
jgi:hypothetical protein